ncbi:MAG: hypothetical protein CSB48_03065, partial [Proteobacteria bacterium]
EQLCIRKFTPRIKNYFKILDNDIGRPLSHISHDFRDIDIMQVIQDVQMDGQTVEKRICLNENQWFMVRIVPYRVAPRMFSGIVVVFVDLGWMHNFLEEADRLG